MQSFGGSISADIAASEPVRTILSGLRAALLVLCARRNQPESKT
jgi:N-methylhydantoinase A/oxoprolinase/acetone carboxylase beta subunit